jgi:small subunit ribosomal protein S15
MALTSESKEKILVRYQRCAGDTGSPEAQIALLSVDIKNLSENHFSKHGQDKHSRRGLLAKVSRRRKLMRYLKHKNLESYQQLIKQLGVRDKA